MKLFNHVQIKVKDLDKSKKFYDVIFSILGFKEVLNIEKIVVGYGTSVYDMFEISQASQDKPLSKSVHIAFNAPSLESVDDFYRAALIEGAECNGAPGLRPQYEKDYYAAFIKDLDGNNIEAVYKLGKV